MPRHKRTSKNPRKAPVKERERAPAAVARTLSMESPISDAALDIELATTKDEVPVVVLEAVPDSVSDLMHLVINRDKHYPMHSVIMSYLGIDDMRNVQLACKKTSKLYTAMKKTQWNINKSLQPFFKNPLAFRSVQSQTETLIGSEFAGKFFRREQIKTELQLFTHAGDKVDVMITYLKQDGYTLAKKRHEERNSGCSNFSVFEKTAVSGVSNTSVILGRCVHAPVDAFLKGCLFSSRACFISWNKAYCIFPVATMLKRTSYLMRPISDTEDSIASVAMKRESNEGFIVKTGQWMGGPVSKPDPNPEFNLSRSIGDKYSWIMDLDNTDVTPAAAPDSLLDDAQFSVDVSKDFSIVPFLTFRYEVLASCVLKHSYICYSRPGYTSVAQRGDDGQYEYWLKLEQLKMILNAEVAMQLTMLEPADRPPQYLDNIRMRVDDFEAKGHFKVPSNWNYFDEEIQSELKLLNQTLLCLESEKLPE